MHPASRISRVAAAGVTLLLAGLLAGLFTGCSVPNPAYTTSGAMSLTGNWQFSSSSAIASHLPALSGELTGTSVSATGIFHSDATTACVSPNTPIEVSGSANAQNLLTLTGPNLAGGTLTLTGTLAPDGKSLTGATYTVTGGACAFATQAPASAQVFASIDGTYNGAFSDPSGQVITLTAALSQNPASDTDGNFQLTGTGAFGANSCFSSPVTVSNTQVTGGSFTLTYADPTTQNSVVVSGTFTTDGTTLNVTNWTLTGSCGPDQGTGTFIRQ
jgi:hypothetical protein